DRRRVFIAEGEELFEQAVGAQLLSELALSAFREGLAGGQDAAHGDVPVTGKQVLGRRPQMDEQPVGAVENEDRRRAVRQPAAALWPALLPVPPFLAFAYPGPYSASVIDPEDGSMANLTMRRIDHAATDAVAELHRLRQQLSSQADVVSPRGRELTLQVFGEA